MRARAQTALTPSREPTSPKGRGSRTTRPPVSASYLSRAFSRLRDSRPDEFGSATPHWTIGSSRKEPRPPEPTPGPGEYSVIFPQDGLLIPIKIAPAIESSPSSVTSSIEFPEIRKFPETKSILIGEKDNIHFYTPGTETPGPSYFPPSFGSEKTCTISGKLKILGDNVTPGPGSYNPDPLRMSTPPLVTFSRVARKSILDVQAKENTPGPGTYNVTKPLKNPSRWAERLRKLPEDYQIRQQSRDRPWAQKNAK